jgi:hypothetical protein
MIFVEQSFCLTEQTKAGKKTLKAPAAPCSTNGLRKRLREEPSLLTKERYPTATFAWYRGVVPNAHCSTCTFTVDDPGMFPTDLFRSKTPHNSAFDINMVQYRQAG